MSICEAPHNVEFGVENIFTMSSILNSIINDQLNHNFLSLITMEREVFSIARYNISILSKSLLHSSFAIWWIMLNETLWSDITSMVLACLCDFITPSESLDWSTTFQEINGFLNCSGSFFGSESNFPWSFQKHTIELSNHLLQRFDQKFRVFSKSIVEFENWDVHVLNLWSGSIVFLLSHC